ncbi:hypothetical protein GX51_08221 [Blastomyces parvus]|uniref:Nuclear RNA binding protein n=1 Tax=Blastomyces parvus TaxID=2060905 RepID=A0A2B7WG32_9EURO|nr:hypothetical protein GX51_08221 [Blastomyces parvus]
MQNDHHHHYSTPTHRYLERQRGSGRAAASPDAANGSAGPNSSAKRKLVNANDDQRLAFDYDYDYDYGYDHDHDDTPKGPLYAVENDAATNNTLEVPAPQYGNRSGASKSSPKRMRSNEWLLKSREVNVSPSQTPGSSKKDSTNSRLRSRRRQSQGKSQNGYRSVSASASATAEGERRSRFLEGSMNDRVSEKPPGIYIGEDIDEAIDRYMTGDDEECTGGSVSTYGSRPVYNHSYTSSTATTTSMSSVATDTTSSAKQSGLLRFGQAIASAFNPFGLWNNVSEIWNGPQDGTQAPTTTSTSTGPKTHKDILAERQAQAEKAYAELKAAGYQGTVKSTAASYRGHPGQEKSSVKKSKHPFFAARTPQQHHKPFRSISSTFSKDNLLSPSKSAIRASFQDLRKAASAINLPLTPKRGDSVDKENNVVINDDDDEDGNSKHVRKQASRRHLEKQRKLRKKVSNLESQLERAKKQLSMVSGEGDIGNESKMGGESARSSARSSANGSASMNVTEDDEELDSAPPIPPPHREGVRVGQRKKFVPGALPSLPSERILLGQVQMADRPTNRTLFTGATPLGPRALKEDKSTSPHRLRKTKREKLSVPATNSRHTSNSTLASDTQGEEPYNHNGAASYLVEEEEEGGGGKYTAPLDSSSVSKRNPAATRKHRLQKPAPPPSLPSSSNNENTLSAPPAPPHYNGNIKPTTHPHPNPPKPKPKTPRRRRSSTTFPTKNPTPSHNHNYYNINNATTTTPRSTDRTTKPHQYQSRRTGSCNGTAHTATTRNGHTNDADADTDADADADAEVEDIPPVPPLPVNFVLGVNARRRPEMQRDEKGGLGLGQGQGRVQVTQQQQEFDWPEDFL